MMEAAVFALSASLRFSVSPAADEVGRTRGSFSTTGALSLTGDGEGGCSSVGSFSAAFFFEEEVLVGDRGSRFLLSFAPTPAFSWARSSLDFFIFSRAS